MPYINDNSLKNINIYAGTKGVNVRKSHSTSASIYYAASRFDLVGYTTGSGYTDNGMLWIEIVVSQGTYKNTKAWVAYNSIRTKWAPADTKESAQDLLDKMIRSDIALLFKINATKALLESLFKQGKNIKPYADKLEKVWNEFKARQLALSQASNYIKAENGNFNEKLQAYWNIMFNHGFAGEIEALPLVAIVVGAVVVGLAIAKIIDWLLPAYDASQKNFKEIPDLTEIFNAYQVPKEKQQKIKTEIERQIDDAYNGGKTDQAWSSLFSIGSKVLLFGLGAAFIIYGIPKIVETSNRNQSKANAVKA